MRLIIILVVVIALALPLLARAAGERDPLQVPLKQYGLMLAIAVLGGLVSWYAKVRRGELAPWNVMQLTGELCTSAFAGLLAFWVCEYMGVPPTLQAALVGVAGHMGTRAISAFEDFAQRKWGKTE